MLQKWLPLLRWYVRELSTQFLTADCLSRAGALTYTSLFAVVPMMTVAYAMFSVLPEFSGVGDRVQGFLFENLVPDSGELLREKLTEFSERARQLTAVGFVFLFVTAFLMLVNVERAFNAIWHVAEPRRGLQRFLLYWGVLSLGPPLIAGCLIVSLYLISLPLVSGLDAFGLHQGREGGLHRGLVQRHQHLAVGVDALRDSDPAPARGQERGRLRIHHQVVHPRALLAPDLEHVLEPLGGEHRDACALLLEDRVGCNRCAVHEAAHVAG